MKIYITIFSVFILFFCGGQTLPSSILKGEWEGSRGDIVIHYKFKNDTTYEKWYSNKPDSLKLFHLKNIDSGQFHIIDKNHFYTLVTSYAREKIIFRRIQ